MRGFHLKQAQVDGLSSLVGNKGFTCDCSKSGKGMVKVVEG